jgi:hypothetical protein
MLSTVLVVPLYLPSDRNVAQYFLEHREEIDALTGDAIVVGLARSVLEGDVHDVVGEKDGKRFPGLVVDALPCLWVESEANHFIVRLLDGTSDIKRAIRVLAGAASRAPSFWELKAMVEKELNPNPGKPVPAWLAVAGYIALGFTLLFLMGTYLLAIFGYSAPENARMVLVFIVAAGLAMGTAFLGTDASAHGRIPIPLAEKSPVAFSVTGGVAVFIVVMLIGYYVYGNDSGAVADSETANLQSSA